MKTFVVSYMGFFDNTMEMEKIQGNSAEEVLCNYLYGDDAYKFRNMSVEDMKQYAFDCDAVVGIIEV